MKQESRVKAVVPNHMKASLRKVALILQHIVEVLQMTKGRQQISIRASNNRWSRGVLKPLITPNLGSQTGEKEKISSTHFIMPPTQQNVVQSTVRFVHTILGRVHGILRVWVVFERLGINDFL